MAEHPDDPNKHIPRFLFLAASDPAVFKAFAKYAGEVLEKSKAPSTPIEAKVEWENGCVYTYPGPMQCDPGPGG